MQRKNRNEYHDTKKELFTGPEGEGGICFWGHWDIYGAVGVCKSLDSDVSGSEKIFGKHRHLQNCGDFAHSLYMFIKTYQNIVLLPPMNSCLICSIRRSCDQP